MIPNFKIVHNQFKLNGHHHTFNSLKDTADTLIKQGKPYEKEIGEFLMQWLDANATLTVKTSGSTGNPKAIELCKQAMVQSALATGNYFKLKPSDTALLCLPATYIAGKMMLVRAMVLGLHLDVVTPSSKPLEVINKTYKFAAMVPMQLSHSIEQLSKIEILIVGGANISEGLIRSIQKCSTKIYATYGMTETITHIAVKKLNDNPSNSIFELLPTVQISQDERGCLIIKASYLSNSPIVTNDVVKLHSKTSFELLGRIDNVINSGGIKIHPEQMEAKLAPFIKADFFVASQSHELLGEQAILVVEGAMQAFPKAIFNDLESYETPKDIVFINDFERTTSGKINRMKTLAKVKKGS